MENPDIVCTYFRYETKHYTCCTCNAGILTHIMISLRHNNNLDNLLNCWHYEVSFLMIWLFKRYFLSTSYSIIAFQYYLKIHFLNSLLED